MFNFPRHQSLPAWHPFSIGHSQPHSAALSHVWSPAGMLPTAWPTSSVSDFCFAYGRGKFDTHGLYIPPDSSSSEYVRQSTGWLRQALEPLFPQLSIFPNTCSIFSWKTLYIWRYRLLHPPGVTRLPFYIGWRPLNQRSRLELLEPALVRLIS